MQKRVIPTSRLASPKSINVSVVDGHKETIRTRFCFSRAPVSVKAPPVSAPDFFVNNRGLPVAVHRFGADDGAPVLSLHGFLDHGRSFALAAEHAPGVTWYAPDARGHGWSGWVGDGGYYHFYDYLDDLRRVLDRLPAKIGLVGHSMGGTLALTLAGLFPERFAWVLLLEGMGPPSHDPSDTRLRLSRWLRALEPDRLGPVDVRRAHRTTMASVEEAASRLCRLNGRLRADLGAKLATSFTEPLPDGGVTWRFDPLHRTPSAKPFRLDEVLPLWKSVQAPVVSLWGEHGFHPDALAERHRALPQVDIGLVERAGHNLHHERPELIGDLVDRLAGASEPLRWSEVCPPEIRSAEPGGAL